MLGVPRAAIGDQMRALTPVHVSFDRVTRTTVGLRPYRAGGFVLRAEGHDGKTIVHDYAHGGGGMTLSWGTARLARDLALQTQKRQAAVIGGVIAVDRARTAGRRFRRNDLLSQASGDSGRYMFPRTDGIVFGGTFQHGNADLTVDPAQVTQIVGDHAAFFNAMRD